MARAATGLAARFAGDDPVILVTVGTTMPFDELFVEVDRLAGDGHFGEAVLCQVGQSQYRMQHCESFVGRPTLRDLIAASSLVISHGGATVVELLLARKPFVAFPNPRGAGDHQGHFLTRMSMMAPISWSRSVSDLERLVDERRKLGPAEAHTETPHVARMLLAELPSVPPPQGSKLLSRLWRGVAAWDQRPAA